MSKAKAADTQPGLKIKLLIGNEEITRFTYGYVRESEITPPSSAKNGQVFLKKYEAVCVKTKDGAVWIQQMRRPKSSNQPFPFKVPSTVHLGSLLHHIPEMNPSVFQPINQNTFQEITFEKHDRIGQIGFDFYNGAMSTSQCERLASTI